jgi:7-cyano-7-deazaguanine synthase
MKKLLILSMSGGLDSATTAFEAMAEGYELQPIVFDYGQKNIIEMEAQKKIVKVLKDRYSKKVKETIHIDLNKLIGDTILQYQNLRDSEIIKEKSGEEYYTPNRNLMFMVLCATIGEVIALAEDYSEISIGLGIHKHSDENYKKDYWDITPEFANRLQSLLSLNDTVKISLYSPFVDKYKYHIIEKAIELDLPMYLTWSCYNPIKIEIDSFESKKTYEYKPCLKCEACLERASQGKKIGQYNLNDYSIFLKE